MYNPSVAQSIEQLSFELTANALAEQERALAGLRTRVGLATPADRLYGRLSIQMDGRMPIWISPIPTRPYAPHSTAES